MSTSIETARRLLREADPLTPDVEQALLARRTPLAAPAEITAGHSEGRGVPPHRRRWLLPLAAAVAVVAIGTTAAVIQRRSDNASTVNGSSQHPFVSHRYLATRAINDLLKLIPVLPGARAVDHAPVPALDEPFQSPGTTNVIDQKRWWTAPGTVADAIAYVKAHVAAPLLAEGSVSGSGGVGPALDGLILGLVEHRSDAYTGLQLLFSVVAYGDGVAVRVDSQAVWLPERTAAEQIPADVTEVDIVVDRGTHAATVRKTLAGDAARSIAQLVNSLPTANPGARSCPMDPGFTDVLTFRGAGPTIVVTATVGGCASVQVGTPNGTQPTLDGAVRVDAAVTRALGLPTDYGR
jgi:hypothetical protein